MPNVDVAPGRHAWIEPGVFEVAPGVHRIPLPMPSDGLRAVNVYAIEDGDGLVLVDSGWAVEQARVALEAALASLGCGIADVRRFLVTHIHRDHYTLGIALRGTFGTRVSLGVGERPSLEALLDPGDDTRLAHFRRAGAAELIERFLDSVPTPSDEGYEPPDDWIEPNSTIELRTRRLHAVPTPGHTRGHLVFRDHDNGLLFSGDHVLPHITPSIGLEAARAELPLGDFLDSLRALHAFPDTWLLPAHGPVTESVHARATELVEHHEQRLTQIAEVIRQQPSSAHEIARNLSWTRRERRFDDLELFSQTLAVGETMAHADLLVVRGILLNSTVDGVVRYRMA